MRPTTTIAIVLAAGLVAAMLPASAGAATTGLRSTFSGGTQGWTAYSLIQIPAVFVPTGGRPGGHVAAEVPEEDGTTSVFFDAPPAWYGDRFGAFRGSISFDIHTDPGVSPNSTYVFLGTGAPEFDNIQFNLFDRPGADWEHHSIPLRPGAGWLHEGNPASELDFVSVLSGLGSAGIGVSGLAIGEGAYLDNPTLASRVKRKLTLSYGGGAFSGKLGPKGKCASKQSVTLYRRKPGADERIGSDRTAATGKYKLQQPDPDDGTYYALAKAGFAAAGGNCLEAKSKTERV
jgi:hypothetical protein